MFFHGKDQDISLKKPLFFTILFLFKQYNGSLIFFLALKMKKIFIEKMEAVFDNSITICRILAQCYTIKILFFHTDCDRRR